jgi:dTDP-4-amino-4,6-dideoxygalactose transaminase
VLCREVATHLDTDPGAIRLWSTRAEARDAALAAATGGGDGEPGEVALPDLFTDGWAERVIAAGLAPLPVDVDAESGALSPRGLARVLNETTRAVVVVHPFGHPAAVAELRRLTAPRNIPIIEDASGAIGASERGAAAGALGDVSLVRLGAPGDDDAPVALRAPAGPGSPAALAALEPDAARRALAWLRADDAGREARRQAAWELTFGLRGMRGASGMYHGRWVRHAYATYVVRLRSLLWRRSLDDTVAALRAEGIPCGPAAGSPLHASERVRAALGAADARLDADHFPVAERLPAELLAIPLAATMTQREVNDVTAALRKLEAAWA